MALGSILVAFILFIPILVFVLEWIQNFRDLLSGIPSISLRDRLRIVGTKSGVELLQLFMKYCQDFGEHTGIFKIRTIFHPVYVITKAETAEKLLASSKNITKSVFYGFLVPWLGRGLLTSTGAKWHARRKMLTPTFHFKILNDFLQVFNEQAAILVKRLDQKVGQGGFDMTPYVTLCTLDIICDTAMGKYIDAQSNSDSEYVKAIYRISEIIMTRIRRPHLWPKFLFRRNALMKEFSHCLRILHQFTDDVIRERRAELEVLRQSGIKAPSDASAKDVDEENWDKKEEESEDDILWIRSKRKRLAFLDLLLQLAIESGTLTDRDVREEVDTFMFEGHDTTSAAVNWVIHLLGANPEVQRKVQQEVDQLFENSDRSVTMDDIKELKYLECVIKESLRLFPSVPFFARHISDECCIGGYTVPKDATAVIMTSYIHMDAKHFPDPGRFDPDRWLPENSVDRHPFCFIPFSAGLRNCIGQRFAMMEEKVLLTYIVRGFEITALQKRSDLHPCGELILRPEKGILVAINRRSAISPPADNSN